MNEFTKTQKRIIGLLVLGFIISLALSAFFNPNIRTDILIVVLQSLSIGVILAVVFGILMLGAKMSGSSPTKTKNSILKVNLVFLAVFVLYMIFYHTNYYVMVILLLIPVLFYPTRKTFYYLTSLFYFVSGFAIIFVWGSVENTFRLDMFLIMIVLLVYSLIPLIIGAGIQVKKNNLLPEKTKLKFYRLKQSRGGVYFVIALWIIMVALMLFAEFSHSYGFIDNLLYYTYWILTSVGFWGIIFGPCLFFIYRKFSDIEIDSKKIVIIRQGKREEIKFKNTNIIKVRGEYTEELTPFKTPILLIRGNKNMDIKLSNYPSKGIHTFKNMLYTYAGGKFKDKKVV